MILTLNPNAALDRILIVDEFRPGGSMRPARWLDKAGGKALDASVALRAFGQDTLAVTILAGNVGQQLLEVLDAYGIPHDIIWIEGETRISHVLVETRHHRHSHITAGTLTVPPAAAAEFLNRAEQHAPAARFIATGGSLPAGVPENYYRQIIKIAHTAQVPVLLDAAGPSVIAALPTPPDVLKMNWKEFESTFETSARNLDELAHQAQQISARYQLPALILTCGQEGLLAITKDGIFHAAAPPQRAINAAGAGDVASAALVWRLSLDNAWPETLRYTAAASAASVLTEGTSDCNLSDVNRILPQTTVTRLSTV